MDPVLKPGTHTTEFWITIATYLINLANLTGIWDFISNWHSGLLMVVATTAYKISRGLAKAGVLRAPTPIVLTNTTP
jgi:hypothetical protein